VLRAIVADDEPLARRALVRLLAQRPDVQVIGEAADVPALGVLLGQLAAAPPDILFLDVRMPGGSGFDIVRHLPPDTAIVFTTAYAEHAARAFEVDAVDFLRKPFGAPRLHEALDRVRRRVPEATVVGDRGLALSAPSDALLLVRVGLREVPVSLASVWRFEGADDCVRVVTAERSLMHTATLQALSVLPATRGFLRVHRRHLVNPLAIRAVVPHDERRVAIEFPDGTHLACSRPGSVLVRRWVRTRRGEIGVASP
jgi:two-component system LytT family response regulator